MENRWSWSANKIRSLLNIWANKMYTKHSSDFNFHCIHFPNFPLASDIHTKAGFMAILRGYRVASRHANRFCSGGLRPQAISPGWPEDSPSSHWPDRGIMVNVCHIPETVEIV